MIRYRIVLAGMLLLILVGCTPTEETPLAASDEPATAALPDEPLLPTRTPAPGEPTATATPTESPTETLAPTEEPTPTPQSPFTQVILGGDLPEGAIDDLWVAPDGRLWVVIDGDIYAYTDEGWELLHEGAFDFIMGEDGGGRIWAIVDDETRIAMYDQATWMVFGEESGWPGGAARDPVLGPLGGIWVRYRDELRRFDPLSLTWETFTADQIGFPSLDDYEWEPEPGRFLTDLVVDQAGNVWVGNCIFSGIVIEGQGVRWFNGQAWAGATETAEECVQDIEVDAAGRVWMAAFDGLIQYDPTAGTWMHIALPEWERPQLVGQLILDDVGNPWVMFTRFGGAGPWHSNAIYHLEDGEWGADFDPGGYLYMIATTAPDGSLWVCTEGVVWRLSRLGNQEIGLFPAICRQMAVDGRGRLWLMGERGMDEFGLWWYEE